MEAVQDRIRIDDFRWLQQRLKEASGTVLEDARKFLAENRLAPLLWRERIPSFADLFERLREEPPGDLARKVLGLVVNNETWFFRDVQPFDQLRLEVLPQLLSARAVVKALRLWSAGCSSGQEAYSLALMLHYHFPQLAGWELQILGTDLLPDQLAKAREGLYEQAEVNRGLPMALLMKYFRHEGIQWRLDPSLAATVSFQHLRLDRPFQDLPVFDVILLRNVLYHFSPETRQEVLGQVRAQLAPDGALFLGANEGGENEEGLEKVPLGKGWCYRHPARL